MTVSVHKALPPFQLKARYGRGCVGGSQVIKFEQVNVVGYGEFQGSVW